ncbi:MAG: galactose-1-epimerase, partial [Clostridia bacterium]|nr:galactose-1-epimerase [Clostridia bacterium]
MTVSGLDKKNFQMEVDGKATDLVVITNANGLEACVTNYGARLVSLMVPDKNGVMEDLVTGFPTIAEYVNQNQNFGATVGRYIGRILGPSFT